MASRRPSAGHRPVAGHLIHRANDVVLGHVGRVSYLPRDFDRRDRGGDDDDYEHQDERGNSMGALADSLGHLHINRMIERSPRIEQVLPFDEWYAPSRADDAGGPSAKSRALRSQQRWLFRSHPEAFVGLGGGLASLIKEETAAAPQQTEGADLISPLLTVGEIMDTTRPTHAVGVSALAMVCGPAGDVVRVVRLRDEKRQWRHEDDKARGEDGDVEESRRSGPVAALSVAVSDLGYEGFWDSEGVPVTKIQLVAVPQRRGIRRWLLVQTALATMVFQPEICAVPSWGRKNISSQGPSFISLAPALTITTDQTGDAPKSDFSFDPGSEDDPHPRLAIIDRAGEWTVWNITGNQGSRHKPLTAEIVHSGYVHDGLPTDRARLIVLGDEEQQCRIAWVAARPDGTAPRARLSALGDEEDEAAPSRAEALVMSTPKTLKIMDLENGDDGAVFAELVDPKRSEAILDVCVCPGDLSRFFVLTSTAVFWLQLTRPRSGTKTGRIAITILLSCPHLRSPIDGTLRMSVTAQDSDNRSENTAAWLVCIFSSASAPRVTLFWFAVPSGSPGAAYPFFHRQTAQLGWDQESATGGGQAGEKESPPPPPPRIRSLFVLARPGLSRDDPKFAQLLILDATLGLRSALCATSYSPTDSGPGGPRTSLRIWRAATDEEAGRDMTVKRKRILRSLRDSFVVRDDYSRFFDVDNSSRAPAKQVSVPAVVVGGDAAADAGLAFRIFDLSPVASIVIGKIAAKLAAGRVQSPQRGDVEVGGVGNFSAAFTAIDPVVRAGIDQGRLSLMTLLEAAGGVTGNLNTDVREGRWKEELMQLRELTNDRLTVSDLAVGSYTTDASSLLERLLHLWPPVLAGLPEEAGSPEAAALREQLVGYVAMEVFLAQFGVSVGPPPSSLDRESSMSAAPETGISSSLEMGLPSPSATPSSSRASSAKNRRDKGKGKMILRQSDNDDYAGEDNDGDDPANQQPQDPAALRLSRYAASIGPVPRRPPGTETALLAHWPEEPGSDPADFKWSWDSGDLARRSEASRLARQARHQRRMERRAALGLSIEQMAESLDQQHMSDAGPPRIGSSQRILTTTQAKARLPRPQTHVASGGHALSSQAAVPQSSQVGGPAGGSAMFIMSQPAVGRHGIRPGAAGRKKKGGKSGFR